MHSVEGQTFSMSIEGEGRESLNSEPQQTGFFEIEKISHIIPFFSLAAHYNTSLFDIGVRYNTGLF